MIQYKMQPGTSSRIYYLLTVKDDGTMMLYFHGTDRSTTEEASVNADGWIVTKGAMMPPLNSGKWHECSTFVPTEEHTGTEHTGTVPMCDSESDSTEGLSPACSIAPQSETPTEPAAEQNPAPAATTPSHGQQLSLFDEEPDDENRKDMAKALGIAALSIVALIVIYNTGLLIPMGLIGMGASGLLK